MKVTDYLAQDHRDIEKMLTVLESMGTRLHDGQTVAAEHLHAAMGWIREFVGGWHLNKEEHLLFPILVEADVPEVKRLLDDFLKEHHEEQHLFAEMARAASSAARKGALAAKDFGLHADQYIKVMREHLRMEDEIYYPTTKEQIEKREKHEHLWNIHMRLENEMGKEWLLRMNETLDRLTTAYL